MRATLWAPLMAWALLACSDSSVPAFSPAPRAFSFGIRGVDDAQGAFVAVTSDPTVLARLEDELARPAAERSLHVNGELAAGDGGHNLGWSWHFPPGAWDMVGVSVELCDGTPAMVEADLKHWLEDVGRFCPWDSFVQQELLRTTP